MVLGPLYAFSFTSTTWEIQYPGKQHYDFLDDSLLYRSIKTIDDRKQLQEDLTTLTKWAETWQMTFHPAKC